MSDYNSTLNEHNNFLDSILTTINNLSDATQDIATGLFNDLQLSDNSILVEGLGFKPKNVLIMAQAGENTYQCPEGKNILVALIASESYANFSTVIFSDSSSVSAVKTGEEKYNVEFTNNGFRLNFLDENYTILESDYYFFATN